MSAQSRVRIRTPEKLRDDSSPSQATNVTTTVPPRWPPPELNVITPEAAQESTSTPAATQPLGAAPDSERYEAPLSSVGKTDVANATAQAETDPKSLSGAKFASCALGAAPEGPAIPKAEADRPGASEEGSAENASTISAPPAAPGKSPPEKTALELAIDGLTALGEQSDKMISEKWSKRAAPILTKSLTFLAAYEAASEDERKAVRKTLKAKSGVSREPNVDNLPVIAVYMGVSCTGEKRTKAQRKEWCRFAVVVKVAGKASIKPDDAAQWLEKKTLNGVLAEWRDIQKAAGKPERKPSVPKALKGYEHLAAALAEGSKFQDLAKGELAKADAAVAEAMSAAQSTASTAAPAEEVPSNA